jgi:hypothetical protein
MLVAGGIDDQPAGRWMARGYAGTVWQLLEKVRAESFKHEPGALTRSEIAMLMEVNAVDVDMSEPK